MVRRDVVGVIYSTQDSDSSRRQGILSTSYYPLPFFFLKFLTFYEFSSHKAIPFFQKLGTSSLLVFFRPPTMKLSLKLSIPSNNSLMQLRRWISQMTCTFLLTPLRIEYVFYMNAVRLILLGRLELLQGESMQ